MRNKILFVIFVVSLFCLSGLEIGVPTAGAINQSSDYEAVPPFLTSSVPPLVMLVMGRNHKLYYEAYNDASDLNEDEVLDIHYEPDIDYYGYFDAYKCYKYQNQRFEPVRVSQSKQCNVTAAGGSPRFLVARSDPYGHRPRG